MAKLKVNMYGDVAVVELREKALDASNSEKFKKSIAEILASQNKVVIDLSRVDFVDSSGCGALLSCLKKVGDQGGELKLCGVQKNVERLFELVRMNRIIDVFPTSEDAIRNF